MKQTINETIKKASVPVTLFTTAVCTSCSVSYADVEQATHDLVLAIISFASSALAIVFVWVLANLKTWLVSWKKKKDNKEKQEANKNAKL